MPVTKEGLRLLKNFEGRGSIVKCGETPLERKVHVKTMSDSLCRMVLWKLLNTCGWVFSACLLLRLKSLSAKGASHQPAFMGNCQTSHTSSSPIYPVDENNEDAGSSWCNILFFFFFEFVSSLFVNFKSVLSFIVIF